MQEEAAQCGEGGTKQPEACSTLVKAKEGREVKNIESPVEVVAKKLELFHPIKDGKDQVLDSAKKLELSAKAKKDREGKKIVNEKATNLEHFLSGEAMAVDRQKPSVRKPEAVVSAKDLEAPEIVPAVLPAKEKSGDPRKLEHTLSVEEYLASIPFSTPAVNKESPRKGKAKKLRLFRGFSTSNKKRKAQKNKQTQRSKSLLVSESPSGDIAEPVVFKEPTQPPLTPVSSSGSEGPVLGVVECSVTVEVEPKLPESQGKWRGGRGREK